MQSELAPIPLERRAVVERLGRMYRHGRLLRRLLQLLEEAERQGLPLTTSDRLDALDNPPANDSDRCRKAVSA